MALKTVGGQAMVFGPSKARVLSKPRVIVETIQVEKAMDKLLPEIMDEFASELDPFADKLVRKIKDGTPVDTGDLEDSVRRLKVKKTKTTVLVTVKAGGVKGKVRGKTIDYATKVHQLGSPRGRGRFFVITPAIEMGEMELPKMARKAVEGAVAKVGK